MPINKNRYPPNWDHISLRIRARDNFTCRHCGATAADAVLTVAHLDWDETNWQVQDDRLLTLCAACHLRYDQGNNQMRKTYGKYYRDNQLEIFD